MEKISTHIGTSPIQPDGRRAAIAATFEQQEALCAAYCKDFGLVLPTLPELRDAFARLSEPREGDDGPVASRRTTLREIVVALPPDGQTDASSALPWFRATVRAFAESTDPRQRAMAATAAREAAELGDDFPQAVLTMAALPTDGAGVRATDVGANMTRYASDNHPPDRIIGSGWAVGCGGECVTWSSGLATRVEVVGTLERLGCRFNDSSWPLAQWSLVGAVPKDYRGAHNEALGGQFWIRGAHPRDGGAEDIGPHRPVRTAMVATEQAAGGGSNE